MLYCSDSCPYFVQGSIECYALVEVNIKWYMFVKVNIKWYMLRISKHCLATCAAEGPERVFIEGKPDLQSMCSHVLIEDVTSCEIQQSAVILVMWNQPVNQIKLLPIILNINFHTSMTTCRMWNNWTMKWLKIDVLQKLMKP